MIFVLELPAASAPRAWFAFDEQDLLRKVVAAGLLPAGASPVHAKAAAEAAEHALQARGDCRIWWTEYEATAAFEHVDDPIWQGAGWRARWALREQLVALEVLGDDL